MQYLRTAVMVAVLSAGSATLAQAQQPQGAPMGARRMAPMAVVDRWLEGITLTAPQSAAIDSVKQGYEPKVMAMRGEMRAAMQSGGGDRASMMARQDSLNTLLARDVRATLDAAQQAAFDRNVETVKASRREMMQRRRGGPGANGTGPA